MFRRACLALVLVWMVVASSAWASDPLPSWNDGASKKAILDFVRRVTDKNSKDFLPQSERIATFDNDGTLWCEQPLVEVAFAKSRIKTLAARNPALMAREAVKAFLTDEIAFLKKAGEKGLLELFMISHAGMTQEEFAQDASEFLRTARHPKLGVRYTQLTYQPMVELLAHLRSQGFQTWICSGGTTDFIRVVSQDLYGIPPQQVIGSRFQIELVVREEREVLMRKPQVAAINDKGGKPIGIDLHIGKRPAFAAGNVRSGGDIAMLRYSQGRKGPSFQLVINHDDDKREFAYAEKDDASLTAAKKHGWTVASMKADWKTVFGPEAKSK